MKIYFIPIFLLILIKLPAQSIIVGFYNCENFYDTTDQLKVIDEDFTPNSQKNYNSKAYAIKSNHLAKVIYGMGKMDNSNGIAIIGLVEIENKWVLEKLIAEPILQKYHYRYLHFDSKDQRGVDVALIYNPSYFEPYQYKPYSLTDAEHFNDYATRDILYVKGRLDEEWVHILVNHWPSRRGGSFLSNSKRIWAANICKKIMDSVAIIDPQAKFIVMGDFNDNPNNASIKSLELLNPFFTLFKNGYGSIAFRDSWSLFDQILLSRHWSQYNNSLTNYKPTFTPSRT
ncbi:MAG: endonuclease/exonuclease/phosphatase [Chitinophagia bacterium]|nr:endonuclease/exonuclease/phosphatase [Chitinophagia bacterium]